MERRNPPARLINGQANSSWVLVCEHASNRFPEHFNFLGLPPELRDSHIAWDPGALAVAEHLSGLLDARLVASTVSRLVYDCNRPPEAPDAMPAQSDVFSIPGNAGLDEAARADRVRRYYRPFESLLADTVAPVPGQPAPVLVTIHSFTPVYKGEHRSTELGVLHDSDARLADAVLSLASAHCPLRVRRNDPYGPRDGVTHTLKRHGMANGLLNVMLEIRNDLVAVPHQQHAMAEMLAGLLKDALAALTRVQAQQVPGADSESEGPECHL